MLHNLPPEIVYKIYDYIYHVKQIHKKKFEDCLYDISFMESVRLNCYENMTENMFDKCGYYHCCNCNKLFYGVETDKLVMCLQCLFEEIKTNIEDLGSYYRFVDY